jgi:hypothetical protein
MRLPLNESRVGLSKVNIECMDVLEWCKSYSGYPMHGCLCDGPYSLGDGTKGFMNARWDTNICFRPDTWKALAQHLLPGAFIMAFAGARTYHRLACALEDAGLILHSAIGWCFGSGLPKATRIDTQVDRYNGMDKVRFLNQEIARARAETGLSLREISHQMQEATSGKYGKWYHRGGHMFFETGMSLPSRLEWGYLCKLLPICEEFRSVYEAAEREVIGRHHGVPGLTDDRGWNTGPFSRGEVGEITAPATDLAKTWAGHRYGLQALKPALEFIAVAQVPYHGKPVQSITETGAGALWIDGGRLSTNGERLAQGASKPGANFDDDAYEWRGTCEPQHPAGRWPPHFALVHHPECRHIGERQVKGSHDGVSQGGGEQRHIYQRMRPHEYQSYADATGHETMAAYACHPECPVKALDEQAGERPSGGRVRQAGEHYHGHWRQNEGRVDPRRAAAAYNRDPDKGRASRFFHVSDFSLDVAEQLDHASPVYYCAKASRAERQAGLNGQRNHHPTQKPLKLCQWLATLLAPPAAYTPRRLLIPFAGAGSEVCAAILSGHWEEILAIEREPEYVDLAKARIAYWQQKGAV